MTFKVNAVLGMRGFYLGTDGVLPAQVTKVHNESLVDIVVFGGPDIVASANNVPVFEYANQASFSYKSETAPVKAADNSVSGNSSTPTTV